MRLLSVLLVVAVTMVGVAGTSVSVSSSMEMSDSADATMRMVMESLEAATSMPLPSIAELMGADNGVAELAAAHAIDHTMVNAFVAQTTCQVALAELLAAHTACSSTLTDRFFASPFGFFPLETATQAILAEYCSAACKLAYEVKLTALAASCSVAEIHAIEVASAVNSSTPFSYRKALAIVRLPCVSRAVTAIQREFCLPSFYTMLTALVDGGGNMTSAMLSQVCVPCIAVYQAAFNDFGAIEYAQSFAYFGTYCVRDGNTWCVSEVTAVNNMPELSDARTIRTCATQCFQKVLSQSLAVQNLFNTSTELVRSQLSLAITTYGAMCVRNAAGALCGNVIRAFNLAENASIDAGCDTRITPQVCPSTCATFAIGLVSELGCCLKAFADLADQWPGSPDNSFGPVSRFIANVCGVTLPSACVIPSLPVRATLVLTNLKYTWYLANAIVFRARLLSDIASIMGTIPSRLNVTIVLGSSPSHHGFHTQATALVATITGTADSSAAAATQQSALAAVIADQSINLPAVSTLTTADPTSKDDSSQSVGVNYAASSAPLSSTGTSAVSSSTATTTVTGTGTSTTTGTSSTTGTTGTSTTTTGTTGTASTRTSSTGTGSSLSAGAMTVPSTITITSALSAVAIAILAL